MAGWHRRKTTYETDQTGKARATSRTITWPGGRTETLSASDLIGVTPEKRMVDGKEQLATDGVEIANYPSSGNLFQRTPAEMRSRAAELAKELGLRTRTLPASPRTPAQKARALADELGTARAKPDECDCPCIPCSAQSDCENCDCGAGCDGESCDSESCQCADHRSAIRPAEGRTIHPTPFIGDIIEEKRIDTAVYEARLKLKLAAASR
jgi:hypothetical protein